MKNIQITSEDPKSKTQFKHYLTLPEMKSATSPAVIIFHDWSGRNEFACKKAEDLARLGYIGFAADLYGLGQVGTNNDEKSALMQPLMQDRALLKIRLLHILETLRTQPQVDHSRIAAIGFCFGGLCALDLARSGAKIQGVISFHGLLQAPESDSSSHSASAISAKILALHGYDDPMVTPDHVKKFADEMNTKKADWQIHMYGHVMHAFTNPVANDPSFGTVFNAAANQRSWIAMKNFLSELFE